MEPSPLPDFDLPALACELALVPELPWPDVVLAL
jgi:hypothetical protein